MEKRLLITGVFTVPKKLKVKLNWLKDTMTSKSNSSKTKEEQAALSNIRELILPILNIFSKDGTYEKHEFSNSSYNYLSKLLKFKISLN